METNRRWMGKGHFSGRSGSKLPAELCKSSEAATAFNKSSALNLDHPKTAGWTADQQPGKSGTRALKSSSVALVTTA